MWRFSNRPRGHPQSWVCDTLVRLGRRRPRRPHRCLSRHCTYETPISTPPFTGGNNRLGYPSSAPYGRSPAPCKDLPMQASHLPKTDRERTLVGPDIVRHILRLILYLSEAQPKGVGYLWSSSDLHPASTNTLTLLSQVTFLDPSKCGSGAYRNTRICQTLCHVMP